MSEFPQPPPKRAKIEDTIDSASSYLAPLRRKTDIVTMEPEKPSPRSVFLTKGATQPASTAPAMATQVKSENVESIRIQKSFVSPVETIGNAMPLGDSFLTQRIPVESALAAVAAPRVKTEEPLQLTSAGGDTKKGIKRPADEFEDNYDHDFDDDDFMFVAETMAEEEVAIVEPPPGTNPALPTRTPVPAPALSEPKPEINPEPIAFDEATFEAFVGQKVKRSTLQLLKSHCRQDLELAVNMFFDGAWRRLEAQQKKASISAKTDSIATSIFKELPERKKDGKDLKGRYLGVFGVEGWATRSGTHLVKYGEVVIIERQKSAKMVGRTKGNKSDVMVRFVTKSGMEVGRIAKEAAGWMAVLMDQGVARFEGSVVYAPERLRTNDTIFLQLKAELLDSAFEVTVKEGGVPKGLGVQEQEETGTERELRMRQVALVKLFKEVNLLPVVRGGGGDRESEEDIQKQRENLLAAAELDEQKKKEGLSGTATPTQGGEKEEEEDGTELEQGQLDALYAKAQSFDFSTPEAEPAETFALSLRGYQKQSLYWMLAREKAEEGPRGKSLHPLWERYRFPRKDDNKKDVPVVDGVEEFYVNPYSGEMSLEFPAQEGGCRGGILADEMGLGKTIQMLSLVHSHRPFYKERPLDAPVVDVSSIKTAYDADNIFDIMAGRRDPVQPAPHTTLVIAPLSLLSQWHSEALKASKDGSLRAIVYYGNDKSTNLQALCQSAAAPDVIITSYGVVLSEFSAIVARNGDRTYHNGLFACRFFRVILDEAHTIKNRSSKTATACYVLEADHRWALTGTPVVNRLEDLFSLVKFLGVEPWNSFAYWRTFITLPFEARNFVKALDVVQTVLEPLVMRRTKDMKMPNGDPLVPLPPKKVEIVEVDLSENERAVYDHVLARVQSSLKENEERGTVGRAYSSIFAQITRLRQVCCHPKLIRNQSVLSEAEANKKARDEIDEMGDDVDLDALVSRFEESVDKEGAVDVKKSFGVNALNEIKKGGDMECPICAEEPMEEQTVTGCWHSACKGCMVEYLKRETDKGKVPRCFNCRKEIEMRQVYEVVRYDEMEGDGKEKILLQRLGTHDSSSKIMKLITHLREFRKTHPTAKVVVFSQFTSFLSIIEPSLTRANIPFLRLDGTLAQKQRASVLTSFSTTPRFTVLLLSLKAGGVGLNLTCARAVYMMDPWWSYAVEAQAIDRVHRMGQTEEVRVYRFIVKGSVEGRMLRVQERKKFIASSLGMMGEEEKKMARIEDIRELLEG